HYSLFPCILPPPPNSTLFPYTTLFRSIENVALNGSLMLLRRADFVDFAHIPGGGVELAVAALLQSRDLRRGQRQQRRVHRCRLRSEEHTSELQSQSNLVCRLLLEKKKK